MTLTGVRLSPIHQRLEALAGAASHAETHLGLSSDVDVVEIGRRLGHDLYCLSRVYFHESWPASVREGFTESATRRLRRQSADRFERKWLQLRLGACTRGRVVADDVTPDLLHELDVSHCPVTRVMLTHGSCADTDWSIDRLNNDGAYAASNLGVMSVRANRAKGALDFSEALAASRMASSSGGLLPIEWLRLAVLMEGPAYAQQPYRAPFLPLCAPLPCRSVRLASQQIQRLFTLQARRPADKNRLVRAFRPASSDERSRLRLDLLGDAVHHGLKRLTEVEQVWDVWLQPSVMDALVRWRDSLDDRGWALAAAISGQIAGGQRVTADSLKEWCLPTRGYQFSDFDKG